MALDLTRYETLEEIQLAERIHRKIRVVPWSLAVFTLAGIIVLAIFGETPKERVVGPFVASIIPLTFATIAFISLNDLVQDRVRSIMHRRRVLDDAINQELEDSE